MIWQAGEARDEHGAEDGGQAAKADGGEQEVDPPRDKSRPTSRASREQVDCWSGSGGRAAAAAEAFLKHWRSAKSFSTASGSSENNNFRPTQV